MYNIHRSSSYNYSLSCKYRLYVNVNIHVLALLYTTPTSLFSKKTLECSLMIYLWRDSVGSAGHRAKRGRTRSSLEGNNGGASRNGFWLNESYATQKRLHVGGHFINLVIKVRLISVCNILTKIFTNETHLLKGIFRNSYYKCIFWMPL